MRNLVLSMAASAALISGFESSAGIVPLKIKQGDHDMGRIYAPMRIGNFGGFMRLDTGASSTRVRVAPWNKDLPVIEKMESMSATGAIVTCDTVEAHNIALEANGSSNVGRAKYVLRRCPKSDGEDLLGLDFFSGAHVVLNFDEKILEVGPQVTHQVNGPVHNLPILESGQPLAAVPLNAGSEDVLGMLDSGAEMSAADSRFVEAHKDQFQYVGEIEEATDAGGNAWAPKLYKVKHLSVGQQHTLKDAYVLVYDFGSLREALGPNTPFIVGFNIMSKFNWAFDFSKGHSPTWAIELRSN